MTIGFLDRLIIVFAVAICLTSYFWLWGMSPGYASSIEIKSAAGIKRYSLLKDQTLSIVGPLGESTIQIKDGEARFISSPCPNQYCVLAGWMRKAGDTAICLPNAISLHVVGGEPLDALNF